MRSYQPEVTWPSWYQPGMWGSSGRTAPITDKPIMPRARHCSHLQTTAIALWSEATCSPPRARRTLGVGPPNAGAAAPKTARIVP